MALTESDMALECRGRGSYAELRKPGRGAGAGALGESLVEEQAEKSER